MQLQSSPPSQVQSCVIVIVVVIKVFPGQGVGHLQDDNLSHARERKKWQHFVFFIMSTIFFVTMLTMMTEKSMT